MQKNVKLLLVLLYALSQGACASASAEREVGPPGCCAKSGERLCSLRFAPKAGAACLCADADLAHLEDMLVTLGEEQGRVQARFNSARHLAAHPPASATAEQRAENQRKVAELTTLLAEIDAQNKAIFEQIRLLREKAMEQHPERVGVTCQ